MRLLPHPALRPFVGSIWSTERPPSRDVASMQRQRVPPSGEMHIAIRVSGEPVRLFEGMHGDRQQRLGHAVVGGARAVAYVRDLAAPVRTVGVQLRPGAAEWLFGIPADELAHRHAPLEDLWGRAGALLLEQLHEDHTSEQQMRLLESALLARLPVARALHPAIAQALQRFAIEPADVRGAVAASGYSHRRFGTLFRRAVGLGPKTFCRIARLQRALRCMEQNPALPWCDVAAAAGYADQAHLVREFRTIVGETPGEHRRR